jgi:hypothetical protein
MTPPLPQGHAVSAARSGRGWNQVGEEAESCSAGGGTGLVTRIRRQGVRTALGAEAKAAVQRQSNRGWGSTGALGRKTRAPARMSGRMRDPGAAMSAAGIGRRLVVKNTTVCEGERKGV